MNNDVESFLQSRIFPEMEHGRPNFDVPHTKAVVRYIKEIIRTNPGLGLDEPVLIIAAYTHDWGYAGLFEAGKPAAFTAVMDRKAAHMELGKKKVTELLHDPIFGFLSPEQKARIAHLVGKHDKLNELAATDELVLMEADTLGGCDSEATTPTFNAKEDATYREETKRRRVSRFITAYSKAQIKDILRKREQYFANLKTITH